MLVIDFVHTMPPRRGTTFPSLIGYLRRGAVPKRSQSHLFQRQDDTALPVLRQGLPNRRRRVFAHHAIQADAAGHSALEIRPSVIRRISEGRARPPP
jgi:hypothetical protein